MESLMNLSNCNELLFVAILLPLIISTFINHLVSEKKSVIGAKCSSFLTGIALIIGLFTLFTNPSRSFTANELFSLSNLSFLTAALILFVSFVVHQFSKRYMDGDRHYCLYFRRLSLITLTATVMAFANHLILFWFAWFLSNILLVILMIHKTEWEAAKNSGILTMKILMPGSLALLLSFTLFYILTGSFSIESVNIQLKQFDSPILTAAILLVVFAAFTQSAIWPFHRWLLSSLNSPTPVSALMHAGLVNGGGLLLVKFSPILMGDQAILNLVFILGATTAFLGSLWKLIQNSIKRMLACSTMAQMGFMMMQCGLGLFPAAVAHLCWHGLFKSYLFLSSGSVVQQRRIETRFFSAKRFSLFFAMLGGLASAFSFAMVTEKPIFPLQATSFLLVFTFMAGAQLSDTLIRASNFKLMKLLVIMVSFLTGWLYGESIHLIEFFTGIATVQSTSLNGVQVIALILFVTVWLTFNLRNYLQLEKTKLWAFIYTRMLNESQPHPKTITTNRKTYQY
ncbi:hypothetical protein B6N58_04740 [Legionella micdadei]|nr:hypothetical protein B6N58_04740 [Legionella micdadei]